VARAHLDAGHLAQPEPTMSLTAREPQIASGPPAPSLHGPLLAYLSLLVGSHGRGRFLDVRWRPADGRMRRRFLPATRQRETARLLTRLAASSDVYVGAALRDGHAHGGRAAIGASHLVWIESDDPGTGERLLSFETAPSIVIASGTPGHLQVYWLLAERCALAEIEAANRRLTLGLGGDPGSADGARILRPPQTLNHKHSPPRPVRLLVCRTTARYRLAELTHGLACDPDPPRELPASRPRRRQPGHVERELLAISSADYVRVLTGRTSNREGKVICPFHPDRNPSLQLYADGGFYCFGSGCGRGGTIIDFAAHLWGIAPRGAGFLQLRERLAERFGLTGETPGG